MSVERVAGYPWNPWPDAVECARESIECFFVPTGAVRDRKNTTPEVGWKTKKTSLNIQNMTCCQ